LVTMSSGLATGGTSGSARTGEFCDRDRTSQHERRASDRSGPKVRDLGVAHSIQSVLDFFYSVG
jgi:hypothetical protein